MRNFRMDRSPREGMLGGLSSTGLWCLLPGLVVLIVSDWAAPDTRLGDLVGGLRPIGWIAIAVGAALIAVHYMGRSRDDADDARDDPTTGLTRPSPLGNPRGAGSNAVIEPVFVDTIAIHPTPGEAAQAAQAMQDDTSLRDDPYADIREASWNPNVLASIDTPRFENLCLAFYAQAGFSTSARAHETGGGLDIWLQSRLMPEPRIVRCKHWDGHTVDLKAMRDFLADMTTHGLHNGTYVTSSSFDADAVEFAKSNGVQVQDAQALLKLIVQRSASQQSELLAAAYTSSTPSTP